MTSHRPDEDIEYELLEEDAPHDDELEEPVDELEPYDDFGADDADVDDQDQGLEEPVDALEPYEDLHELGAPETYDEDEELADDGASHTTVLDEPAALEPAEEPAAAPRRAGRYDLLSELRSSAPEPPAHHGHGRRALAIGGFAAAALALAALTLPYLGDSERPQLPEREPVAGERASDEGTATRARQARAERAELRARQERAEALRERRARRLRAERRASAERRRARRARKRALASAPRKTPARGSSSPSPASSAQRPATRPPLSSTPAPPARSRGGGGSGGGGSGSGGGGGGGGGEFGVE